MKAKSLGTLVLAVTLLASGAYVFVYLYRWEWNRALVSASIFLAAEVGLIGWRLAERMGRVQHDLRAVRQSALDRRLDVLSATRPSPRAGFAWMVRSDRSNVFIPVLLGAGAIMSGLAWIVERLARATVGRAGEHHLAASLGALDLPAGGLLDEGDDPLAILRGPRP